MTDVHLQARRPLLGYAVYASVIVMFAVNGTVSKSLMIAGLSAERLSQLRSTGAFVVLLLLTLLLRPRALRTTKREFAVLAAYGVFGMTMQNYLYFVAIKHLPVGIALVLEFTAPIWIALWMRFVQGKPVRRELWFGIALAVIGLTLVARVWHGLVLSPLGLAAGIGAALALALYYLVGERIAPTRDPLSLNMWAFAFSSLFWAAFQPWMRFPWHLLEKRVALPTRGGVLSVPATALAGYMIIIGTVIAFAAVAFSLRHLAASQASLFGMLEPVVAALVAWAALGENLLALQMLGGALIIGGIMTAELSRLRAQPDAPAVTHVD